MFPFNKMSFNAPMKRIIFIICIFFSSSLLGQKPDLKSNTKNIELVICADLSASTNGLIQDIKQSFWMLINHNKTLIPKPVLRIGIIFYGRPSFGIKNNYVRVLSDLTTNYDSLFLKMDELNPTIEKGDQYVGAALSTALNQLSWSKDKTTLKMIYLIGNGKVDGGTKKIDDVCKVALSKGIVIESVYCYSSILEKEIKGWENIANQTNGKTATTYINKVYPSNINVSMIELWKSNKILNQSFIYYGEHGLSKYKLMNKTDSLAHDDGNAMFTARLMYKLMLTNNDLQSWDLVSYFSTTDFNLLEVNRSTLPVEYSNTVGSVMMDTLKNKEAERIQKSTELKLFLKNDLSNLLTNSIVKEDIGDEGYLYRIIVKSYMKMAATKGFSW